MQLGSQTTRRVKHENELHVGPFQHANVQLIRMSLESPKSPISLNTCIRTPPQLRHFSFSLCWAVTQSLDLNTKKKANNKCHKYDRLGLRNCVQMALVWFVRLHYDYYIMWQKLACGVKRCSKDFKHGICCVNHISHKVSLWARHAHMAYAQFPQHKFYRVKLFSNKDVIKIDIGILLINIYKWLFCDIIRARQ